MRKVMLDVEFVFWDAVVFAYCCVGVETRRNLYVKFDTDQNTVYFKIPKKDTKISNSSCIVDFDVYRVIQVPLNVGFEDERLQILEDEQMIKEVDEVVSWCHKEFEKKDIAPEI